MLAQRNDRNGRSWTMRPLLRIRRLGVRVPPSARTSERAQVTGLFPHQARAFLVSLGATLGATGDAEPPNRARLIDSAAARLSPSSRWTYTSLVIAMLACPSTS